MATSIDLMTMWRRNNTVELGQPKLNELKSVEISIWINSNLSISLTFSPVPRI